MTWTFLPTTIAELVQAKDAEITRLRAALAEAERETISFHHWMDVAASERKKVNEAREVIDNTQGLLIALLHVVRPHEEIKAQICENRAFLERTKQR